MGAGGRDDWEEMGENCKQNAMCKNDFQLKRNQEGKKNKNKIRAVQCIDHSCRA